MEQEKTAGDEGIDEIRTVGHSGSKGVQETFVLSAFGNPLIDLYIPIPLSETAAAGLAPGTALHASSSGDHPLLNLSSRFLSEQGLIESSLADRCGCLQDGSRHAYPAGGAFTVARLIAEAGIPAIFCGSVGSDGGEELFARAAERSGLRLHLQKSAGKTGWCRYFYDPEHPDVLTIGVTPEAARSYQPGPDDRALAAGSDWLYIEGFVLGNVESLLDSAAGGSKAAGDSAEKAGWKGGRVKLAVDLGSPFAAGRWKALIRRVSRQLQLHLLGTEAEFAVLFECSPEEVEDACIRFLQLPETFRGSCCIVKYGPEGSCGITVQGAAAAETSAAGAGASAEAASFGNSQPDCGNPGVVIIRQPPERIVPTPSAADATGAGDAFAAGYLIGAAAGRPLGERLKLGTAAAAAAVKAEGPPFPPDCRD